VSGASGPDGAILEVRKDAQLTRWTLNRPAVGNSLSNELVLALSQALARCHEDGTRVLAIEGSGPHFCTGFDLSRLDDETDETLLARFVRVELLLQQIHGAPFVTVALAHGRAIGAGADLFAACEQRWVLGSATFSFPGAAFGIVLGTSRLARRVSSTQAREWIRSGAIIRSEDALHAGLASRVIAPGDADAALAALGAGAGRLDSGTLAAIHEASQDGCAAENAADLYRLARSAARPGLRERILRFSAASKARA
jgi:enoyl-CoA hydratase/carnithine racemase